VTNWTPVTLLSDEPQDQTFFEPWQPKIGDRVRVRLNGECRFETFGMNRHGILSERKPSHREWEDGKTGTVVLCRWIAEDGYCLSDRWGHGIVIEYDTEVNRPDIFAKAGHYAACELEPLL
jgi:hypothetical protein